MLALGAGELEGLRALVAERLGLACDGDRLDRLADVARERIPASKAGSFAAYLERVRREAREGELAVLAERLTVTETFFFRHPEQLQAFVEAVALAPERRAAKRLRILSAGCASGEEPYSLVIALAEVVPDFAEWDVQITAIDVNRTMLARAARAHYGEWSLRATADRLKERYFRREGPDFVLDAAVRRLVRFEERNLAEPDAPLWRAPVFDAVFCRNVLMYFAPAVTRRVVEQFRSALVPDGHLFLGHAETLRGVSHGFHLCHSHGAFYYQRREGNAAEAVEPARPARAQELGALPVSAADSWFSAIGRASERIRMLSEQNSAGGSGVGAPSGAEVAARADAGLAPVLELFERERFGDALALLGALPPSEQNDPDALLLRAVLLANHGRIAEAERLCERLLALDELNAGAHYVTALCREHAGEREQALEHDRIAMHLDASFAMPHLHAGLLAKRGGERDLARRLLAEALELVEREDSSRLVLFGGGFSRDALATLCRGELARLGGVA